MKASDYVREITSRAQLDSWLSDSADSQLHILDVSLTSATPCVHIFPAVLALAKNMAGFASFARLMADKGSEAQGLAKEYKVVQVRPMIAGLAQIVPLFGINFCISGC